MPCLSISDYAQAIALHDSYQPTSSFSASNDNELVEQLLQELHKVIAHLGIKDHASYSIQEKRSLLEAVITTLPPDTLTKTAIEKLNQLLQNEMSKRELFNANELAKMPFFKVNNTKVILWRGDITTLKIDAIVNAANNKMLGCFQPMHKCIDNIIHNRAGVQLRKDCATIMNNQGFDEPTGMAKITRAYNLPADYVIHTVGPIIKGNVTSKERDQLASCYTHALDISNILKTIKSIAFCSISTGVFGYPIEQATQIAIETVSQWLKQHPNRLDIVIFNVFSEKDHVIYQSTLEDRACQ